ncbi:MAG: hypothetical protein ACJARR_002231 [Pseudophaeobacter arcticus]|jgi:hypothetical protein
MGEPFKGSYCIGRKSVPVSKDTFKTPNLLWARYDGKFVIGIMVLNFFREIVEILLSDRFSIVGWGLPEA